MIVLRNKASKKEYPVTRDEWDKMQKAGKGKLFEVVREEPERPVRALRTAGENKPRIPLPATVEQVMASKKGPDAGPGDQTASN